MSSVFLIEGEASSSLVIRTLLNRCELNRSRQKRRVFRDIFPTRRQRRKRNFLEARFMIPLDQPPIKSYQNYD